MMTNHYWADLLPPKEKNDGSVTAIQGSMSSAEGFAFIKCSFRMGTVFMEMVLNVDGLLLQHQLHIHTSCVHQLFLIELFFFFFIFVKVFNNKK